MSRPVQPDLWGGEETVSPQPAPAPPTDYERLLFGMLSTPTDDGPRLVLADWCDENGRPEQALALREGRVLLHAGDRLAAKRLAVCRFAPASWDKKFVRQVCEWIAGADPLPTTVTVRQLACIWRLMWKYRKQISEPCLERYAALLSQRED